MTTELAITPPDGSTRTIRLEAGRLTLGRSGASDLSYPEDVGLSRQHMALEKEGEEWAVCDLGSKNGTFVNGVRVAGKVRLRSGDRITASHVALVYDPAGATAKTVLFERMPELTVATVSTNLDRLLGREGQAVPAAPGAAPPLWASPVTALVRAGRELAVRRPLPELFRVILDLAIEAVDAERGLLLTSEKGELAVQAWRGEDFHISTAVRDRVLEGKDSVLVQDIQLDAALRSRMSIVAEKVRSLMAVPLQTDERVIGLIYVDSPRTPRLFSPEDLNLLTVMANVAAIRIEHERLAEIEQSEHLLESELEQAAEIQRRFLPADVPEVRGMELAGLNVPCRMVGGDYYDFLHYPDGKVGLVIGDVAGKGMPAALMMTCLQAKVQAIAETSPQPASVVTRLNRSLAATCPQNRFVTFFFSVFDPASGELAYCNAGHNPPLLVRAGGEVLRLETGGPVLGILPALNFREERCALDAGDLLFLYSDGVTEAASAGGEEFGEERLTELLLKARRSPAAAIVNAVHDAVRQWAGEQAAADDITIVAARRVG